MFKPSASVRIRRDCKLYFPTATGASGLLHTLTEHSVNPRTSLLLLDSCAIHKVIFHFYLPLFVNMKTDKWNQFICSCYFAGEPLSSSVWSDLFWKHKETKNFFFNYSKDVPMSGKGWWSGLQLSKQAVRNGAFTVVSALQSSEEVFATGQPYSSTFSRHS